MIPGSLAQAIEQMVGVIYQDGKVWGTNKFRGKGHGFLDLLSLRCQEDIQEVDCYRVCYMFGVLKEESGPETLGVFSRSYFKPR